jgi:cardiolipin synthase (CMP-forming)
MNFPNLLTFFRLFLIPVFILIFFSNIHNAFLYSILVFLIAGLTDTLDGYIARKFNLITKWGIILDPLADKLMLVTVLTCLVVKNYIPLWVLIIMTAKETAMITAGILLFKNDTIIASDFFGKLSTLLFYISIFILSLDENTGTMFIYVAVGSSIIAFINYYIIYIKNKKALKTFKFNHSRQQK